MYTKIYASMFDGTLHGDPDAIITFMVMLVLASPDGYVDLTPKAISSRTSIPLDVIERGIASLSLTDKLSRSTANGGRRIELLDPDRLWGWKIVNFVYYRNLRSVEDKRAKDRERIAAKRNGLKANGGAGVANSRKESRRVAEVAHTDTDTDTDTKNVSVPSAPHSGKPERFSEEVETVFKHWKAVHQHPRGKLDSKRKALIRSALKTYPVADLCQSISGYLNSPHHMGQNERGTRYTTIELFLRDAAHIDAGLRFYEDPPRTDLSKLSRGNVDRTSDWQPPEMRNGTE